MQGPDVAARQREGAEEGAYKPNSSCTEDIQAHQDEDKEDESDSEDWRVLLQQLQNNIQWFQDGGLKSQDSADGADAEGFDNRPSAMHNTDGEVGGNDVVVRYFAFAKARAAVPMEEVSSAMVGRIRAGHPDALRSHGIVEEEGSSGEETEMRHWSCVPTGAPSELNTNHWLRLTSDEELYDEDGFLIELDQTPGNTSTPDQLLEVPVSQFSDDCLVSDAEARRRLSNSGSFLRPLNPYLRAEEMPDEYEKPRNVLPESETAYRRSVAVVENTYRGEVHEVEGDTRKYSIWPKVSDRTSDTGVMTPLELDRKLRGQRQCRLGELQIPKVREKYFEEQAREQRRKLLQEATVRAEKIARQRQHSTFSWDSNVVEQTVERARRIQTAYNRRRYWKDKAGRDVGIPGSVVALHEIVVQHQDWVSRQDVQRGGRCINVPEAPKQRRTAFPTSRRAARSNNSGGKQQQIIENECPAPRVLEEAGSLRSFEDVPASSASVCSYTHVSRAANGQNDFVRGRLKAGIPTDCALAPSEDVEAFEAYESVEVAWCSTCSFEHVMRAAHAQDSVDDLGFCIKETTIEEKQKGDEEQEGKERKDDYDVQKVNVEEARWCWLLRRPKPVRPLPGIPGDGTGFAYLRRLSALGEVPSAEKWGVEKQKDWCWRLKAERRKLFKRPPPNALPARFPVD